QAPAVAHLFQLERIQQSGGRLKEIAQRSSIRIHVDPYPAAPSVDLDLRQGEALPVQPALPVLAIEDTGAFTFEVVFPGMVAAAELLHSPTAVGQPAAAMGADVEKRADFPG